MCGRFTLRKSAEVMAAYFNAHDIPTWSPRYKIAPTQDVLTLFQDEQGDRQWALRQWGLVPGWSKEPKVSFSNINARVENIAKSPAFRGAFKHRRCLLPADGFYEWSGPKGHKRATFFHLKDDAPLPSRGCT
jgi:putative SOS response-associated peptidase YedK